MGISVDVRAVAQSGPSFIWYLRILQAVAAATQQRSHSSLLTFRRLELGRVIVRAQEVSVERGPAG